MKETHKLFNQMQADKNDIKHKKYVVDDEED